MLGQVNALHDARLGARHAEESLEQVVALAERVDDRPEVGRSPIIRRTYAYRGVAQDELELVAQLVHDHARHLPNGLDAHRVAKEILPVAKCPPRLVHALVLVFLRGDREREGPLEQRTQERHRPHGDPCDRSVGPNA